MSTEQVSSSQEGNSGSLYLKEIDNTGTSDELLIGVIQNKVEKKKELLEQCNLRAYLDGTYFVPDLEQSTFDGTIVATCQLCQSEYQKDQTISGLLKVSSNFTSHVKKMHKRKFNDYQSYLEAHRKKIKLDQTTDQHKIYCSFSQAVFEENVINFVLESLCPLNIVETKAFRKIFDDMNIKKGGQKLRHLSAKTLTRKIKDTFTANMRAIKDKLKAVSYVCTTADVWSSKSQRYMGMTIHWIDEVNFERKSFAIACRRFPGDHTYDRISAIIEDIHLDFGVNDTVIATVTDNASNFGKAFKESGIDCKAFFDGEENVEESNATDIITDEMTDDSDSADEITNDFAEIDGSEDCNSFKKTLPKHLLCASHTLSLIATKDLTDGIKSCSELNVAYSKMIERCNNLWAITKSPKKKEYWHSIIGSALKRPVITRWNSLFDSLRQLFGLKEKILTNTEKLNNFGLNNILRNADFRFIDEYLTCNKPIADAIDKLQGEKLCSYGYLLPTLITVQNQLKNCQQLNLRYCKKLPAILLNGLIKRFKCFFDVEHQGRISAVAAASHPKFKLKWLHCLEKTAQKNVMAAIKDALAVSNTARQPCVIDDCDDDEYFDFSSSADNQCIVYDTFGTNDLEMIFQKFNSESRTDLQLLNLYPIIKTIYIKFNTPIPSSAAVERLFSYATMLSLPKFNQLTDTNFELRVLMKCNSSANKNTLK
ncbi:uncharacterized protein LOC130674635 [Microplitis mediator]|uniref:uncharacterized protein LOC130674635 n=1 Tax=Microplitis mediator TaxID=375433 RepID=UPI002555FC9C|nr:uncharacterized protein LOC130674635 [Microplitis mediator]